VINLRLHRPLEAASPLMARISSVDLCDEGFRKKIGVLVNVV
jgi:hypothetical protein